MGYGTLGLSDRYQIADNDRDGEWIAEQSVDPTVVEAEELCRKALLSARETFWTAVPDCTTPIGEIVEGDADRAIRLPYGGSHRGEYPGTATTDGDVETTEVVLLHSNGGRFAEMWFEWDEVSFLEQPDAIDQIPEAKP